MNKPITWVKAADLTGKEKALDDLLAAPFLSRCYFNTQPDIPPGSTSVSHREVLLFAAAEYDRLAAEMAGRDNEARQRFLAKARQIRELAGK